MDLFGLAGLTSSAMRELLRISRKTISLWKTSEKFLSDLKTLDAIKIIAWPF